MRYASPPDSGAGTARVMGDAKIVEQLTGAGGCRLAAIAGKIERHRHIVDAVEKGQQVGELED